MKGWIVRLGEDSEEDQGAAGDLRLGHCVTSCGLQFLTERLGAIHRNVSPRRVRQLDDEITTADPL